MCPAQRSRACTADSCPAQGAGPVRSGDPFQPGGLPQSAGGGLRIPPFSEAGCRARGHQRKDLPPPTPGAGARGLDGAGKKTAAAIHQEVAREIDALLRVIFTARRKTDALDLEAVEMALRAALQQAGAAGLSQLLRQECPAEPQVPCSCGGQGRYKGMGTKPLVTVVGRGEMRRAYYWCSRCQQGQFSADPALDVENTELSPGVRRMLTLVGSECSSCERGREQIKLLAGLEVTTKAVERTTESIGADIAQREQDTIQQALQRELPIAVGQAIPVMYVQMDGTGVPMVSKELEGRKGKGSNGRAHTREVKLGGVFTQTTVDAEGWPVRDENSTTYTGAIETGEEVSRRLYTESQRRGWGRGQEQVVMGDGAEWICDF